MARDEDIGAALPQPPPPAPARRAAAIGAAMRRFDGLDDLPADARQRERAKPRSGLSRPQLGLVASAMLVALIGAPAAWMSLRHPVTERQPQAAAPSAARQAEGGVVAAADSVAENAVEVEVAASPAAEPGRAEDCAGDDCVVVERSILGNAAPEARPSGAEPVPPPPPPAAAPAKVAPSPSAPPAEARRDAPPAAFAEQKSASSADAEDSSGGDLVVTGTRISRSQIARRERGEWNACTISDPRRALARCRSEIAVGAKGGNAAAAVGEGLSHAWEGDMDEAIAAFDRAIAQAPRSSLAYLNRGLAYQRSGDLDRAIADFDRAIRYAPASARAWYLRSEALRQRGDTKRADRDLRRAIDLDPDYRNLLD